MVVQCLVIYFNWRERMSNAEVRNPSSRVCLVTPFLRMVGSYSDDAWKLSFTPDSAEPEDGLYKVRNDQAVAKVNENS